jgi:hypothetical protein
MYYKLRHFSVPELVPPDLYKVRGDEAIIVMDFRILWTLDALRDHFGKPITVNNWKSNGPFQQRGFRNDATVGALLSQHRYGRAADFDIAGVTASEFREMVRSGKIGTGPNEPLQYITAIEETNNGQPINWIHIDCRNADIANGINFIHA